MARTVVIDWQRDSLMVAVGSRRGAAISIEQVRLLPVGETANGTVTASQVLRSAIQEMGLAKADAIVIASRELVEIRTLTVPNVEPEELPDIVRFQAQRQMANVGETWPLDYILLPNDGIEGKVALAGAISPAHMAEIESAVVGAGLQLSRLLLRPIEIARFAVANDSTGTMLSDASVVVCLSGHQSDLLLLKSGALVQLRSTRLPSEEQSLPGAVVGEIKRSLVAAANQLNGTKLASAHLIASADVASKVEQPISGAVSCSVRVIDPLVMLPAGLEGAEELSRTAANRLAAVAGVIGTPNPDKRTLIDFKSPKKRPPKEVNYTRYVLAAVAAGLLLLAAGSWWYSTTSAMDAELASLRKEIADKKDLGEIAVKQIAEFTEVKKVLDASPSWIDELERIALNMPSSEKVILWSPTFTVMANGEGLISTKVYGVSSEVIAEFEEMLRKDDKYRVSTGGVSKTEQWREYPFETTAKITFKNRGWKLLEEGQSAAPAQGASAGPKTPAEKPTEKPAENSPEPKAGPEQTSPSTSEPKKEAAESETPKDVPAPTTPDKPKGNEVVGGE